jgi:hypothetical protein
VNEESIRLTLVTLLTALEHSSQTSSMTLDVLMDVVPGFREAYQQRVDIAKQSSGKSLASEDTNTVGRASIELASKLAHLLATGSL